jgi:hypothetical protein
VTRGDRVTFGERLVVPAGTVHRGGIVAIGGDVVVEGEVREVVVIAGSLSVLGRAGESVAVFSKVTLGKDAEIGNFVNVGGSLEDQGAEIRRDYVNVPIGLRLPFVGSPLRLLAFIFLIGVAFSLLVALIAIFLAAGLVPERVERLADELPARPFLALGVGFAGYLLLPLIILLCIVTVLGIAAIPVVVVVFWVAKWLGTTAVFYLVGRRMARGMKRELSFVGTMLLGFLPFALLRCVPFLGALAWWIVGMIGVGLVLVTRGARARQPAPPPLEPLPDVP